MTNFLNTQHTIVKAFEDNRDYGEAVEIIEEVLSHCNLDTSLIAEIMLSVFKVGKATGKEVLKGQIAGM